MTSTYSANAIGLPPARRGTRHLTPTPAALRRRLEHAAERIIEALDLLDAHDEDREPEGADEPALGAVECAPQARSGVFDRRGARRIRDGSQEEWAQGLDFDDDDPRESNFADDDGRLLRFGSRIVVVDELEGVDEDGDDINDRGQDEGCDEEPSLGATTDIDQRRAWAGATVHVDLESDDAGDAPEPVRCNAPRALPDVAAIVQRGNGRQTLVRRGLADPLGVLAEIWEAVPPGAVKQIVIKDMRR